MNLPRTISPETMLTMSWISPFCKRNIRFRLWFDRCKTRHRTNSFIPANLPPLSPFSNFIVSRRCVVFEAKREREREWQTKLTNETSKWNVTVMIYENKNKKRRKRKRRRDVEMEMNRQGKRGDDARNKSGINDDRDRCVKFNGLSRGWSRFDDSSFCNFNCK